MPVFNLPSNLPNNLKGQVFDARKVLPTNPKYTWESLKGLREQKTLTTIALHHDAISKKDSAPYSDLDFAKRIARSHINTKRNRPGGDPGFPYHIWIRNGVIYVCNDLEAFTYGVAGNNSYTVHICVSGNYAGIDTLEDKDRNALYAAILMVQSMIPTLTMIKAHKELSPTACPGYDVNKVRQDVAAIVDNLSTTPTPTPGDLNEELDNTENATKVKIFAAYTRFNDLYKKAITEGPNQEEAQKKCLQIADSMVQAGILKQ
jgi:hypothetical protein